LLLVVTSVKQLDRNNMAVVRKALLLLAALMPAEVQSAMPPAVMAFCDYDSNGLLDFDEFVCQMNFFTIIHYTDHDLDGMVGLDEFDLFSNSPELNPDGLSADDLFLLVDYNGDGRLSIDEVVAIFDEDKNGLFTNAEFNDAMSKLGVTEQLPVDELRSPFVMADLDDDDMLNDEEIRKWAEPHRLELLASRPDIAAREAQKTQAPTEL